MGLSACFRFALKSICIVLSLACMAIGSILIAVGSIFCDYVKQYSEFLEKVPHLNWVPFVLIAAGVVTVIISLVGCIGAYYKNSCMLISYVLILIILITGQLVVCIYGVAMATSFTKDLETNVTEQMKEPFKHYKDVPDIKEKFREVQTKYGCCGPSSPADYAAIGVKNVPGSCCGKADSETCSNESLVNVAGCGPKMFEAINGAIKKVHVGGFTGSIVEIAAAVFSIFLICTPAA